MNFTEANVKGLLQIHRLSMKLITRHELHEL